MTQIIMGPGGSGCFGTKLAPVPRMLNEATTLTCGLRIPDNPTSDNLTPQETTNQDAPDLGSPYGGLLMSLMGAAIPFVYAESSLLPLCSSLSLFVSI
jgi:hypothetical protein